MKKIINVLIGLLLFANLGYSQLLAPKGLRSNDSIKVVSPVGKQTGEVLTGNVNGFYQLNIINTNAGASASSDIVATANDGTNTINYVDLGINGSGGGSVPFQTANEGYLYSGSSNLNIGSIGSGTSVKLYSGNSSTVPNLTIGSTGTVTIPDLSTGVIISYNTSIPFDHLISDMATHTLTGNDVFSINSTGAVNNACTSVLLVNNVSYAPDLTAFHNVGIYDNTLAYTLLSFTLKRGLYIVSILNFD